MAMVVGVAGFGWIWLDSLGLDWWKGGRGKGRVSGVEGGPASKSGSRSESKSWSRLPGGVLPVNP